MKDIPIFTTEYGVASLLLKEIPYRRIAYIQVQDVQPEGLSALIEECAGFCRACGAERIFWSAEEAEGDPFVSILQMRGTAWVDKEKLENLFPVTEQTVARWREIYNHRMQAVDNASTLTSKDEAKILSSNGAYFIHHSGELLGIGWVEDDKLLAIAATKPGAGERAAHSLMSLSEGAMMTLEVASTNEKAIGLYERLGFIKTRVIRKWYLY